MKEYFEKVYIKSEDDLPKEIGRYFVYVKDVGEDTYDWVNTNGENAVEEYWNGQFQEDYWINTFDWYLRPIEQKPDCYPKEFLLWYFSDTHNFGVQQFSKPPLFVNFEEGSKKKYTLDELFIYWQNNIKDKK